MTRDEIRYSSHAAKRRIERGYSKRDVRQALKEGRVIEEYPDTGRGPSSLILHWTQGRPLHVVAAEKHNEKGATYSKIVTLYDPQTQPEKWNEKFSERRR